MSPTTTKIGLVLAKGLGIKLENNDDPLTRGESAYSVSTADTYVEEEPHSLDWLKSFVPAGRGIGTYFRDLFPFTRWILRYNLLWFVGDLIAGITVGCVVVPQGMAYAKLALLPVEFGLYTSFVGVCIYWFFATSKDITIGPVAVMSTIVGNVVQTVQEENPDVPAYEVATCLAVICGCIITFIGLIRAGWIVEFIPLTAISAFMTGSAISICAGQVPALLGIRVQGFNTRDATYKVIINTFRYLGRSKVDAAMGLSALFFLYFWRWVCNRLAKKHPAKAKTFFIISTLRTAVVIMLFTLFSFLANRGRGTAWRFQILGPVPRGFQHAEVPRVDSELIGYFASELPASVIVLLIEHIAISKSFGRINNYTINPSQELVAIGVTNLIGPFLGGYPATGSFSRTAIKSKAGVRTPFAGVITGIVVLLAIYALPAAFYYIPNSSLAGVIIHAVGDLITPPNVVYQFYRVSPLEIIIFFAGVFVTIFTNIENGVYTTICMAIAVLLFRVVKANGTFVGKVKIHSVIGDHLAEDKFHDKPSPDTAYNDDAAVRNIFLPLEHDDGSNPNIQVESPYRGVFIYRFSEGFNYPNANHYLDHLTEYIFKHTRRTNPDSWPRLGDRPWNNPGPGRGKAEPDRSHLPTLKAIILDFSSVNNVDVTSVQNLIDVRNQLDRYTSPEVVQWHLASIKNKWTKRALASAGFGFPSKVSDGSYQRHKAIFSVAEIGGVASAAEQSQREYNRRLSNSRPKTPEDIESHPPSKVEEISNSSEDNLEKELAKSGAYVHSTKKVAVVHGLNRPFFHIDLTSAVQAAIATIEANYSPPRKSKDEELNDRELNYRERTRSI